MSNVDKYQVTINRINQGRDQAPYETWRARTLTITAEGELSIQSEGGEYKLSSGLWDGFEVRMLRHGR
jgi:hypothetical protein